MPIAYQYTADGYYAGFAEDYGLLPNNATRTAPDVREGVIPHWNGSAWEQIEDHKGKEGYVNGEPHEIKEYGPLPEGWSDTPPAPTTEQLAATARAKRDSLIESVRWRIERHSDELALGSEPTEPLEPLLQYAQDLRDVPQQAGFPEAVEWPDKPTMEKNMTNR